MNVRDFAKPYEWRGITLWFLSYKSTRAQLDEEAFAALIPRWEWKHPDGRTSQTEPEELTKAREKWQRAKLNKPFVTRWEVTNLWGILETTFALVEPLIVGIDFPDTPLDGEAAALRAYWTQRPKTVAERWDAFAQVIGVAVFNMLWEAYEATRDNPAPAAPELGEPPPDGTLDPNATSAGDESTTTTNS